MAKNFVFESDPDGKKHQHSEHGEVHVGMRGRDVPEDTLEMLVTGIIMSTPDPTKDLIPTQIVKVVIEPGTDDEKVGIGIILATPKQKKGIFETAVFNRHRLVGVGDLHRENIQTFGSREEQVAYLMEEAHITVPIGLVSIAKGITGEQKCPGCGGASDDE